MTPQVPLITTERLQFLIEEIERYHIMASGLWGVLPYTPKEMGYIQERVVEVQTLLGCIQSAKYYSGLSPGDNREEWTGKFKLVVERAKGWAETKFM